ncbi:Nitrilase family, member 2 [Seminavis robusta]|uniref:Nitrilase family, member 2 n=1 Tax=Seminavis robusta TaxID=568900 RepID=A0A9N8H8Q6_9STRA|nr:Nitrilase family, member 2 [Seminavis robusta]|eukprot:Sro97_g050070.1 Nitrilase family, member 2 (411) ;mRNA; f:83862-85217
MTSSPSRANDLIRMPPNFFLTDTMVLCAKGTKAMQHPGNLWLRSLVKSKLDEYSECRTKKERSTLVNSILHTIKEANCFMGGSFVRQIDGVWYDVGYRNSREKIGQYFRDFLPKTYKSSTKAKSNLRRTTLPVGNDEESPGKTLKRSYSENDVQNSSSTEEVKPPAKRSRSVNIPRSRSDHTDRTRNNEDTIEGISTSFLSEGYHLFESNIPSKFDFSVEPQRPQVSAAASTSHIPSPPAAEASQSLLAPSLVAPLASSAQRILPSSIANAESFSSEMFLQQHLNQALSEEPPRETLPVDGTWVQSTLLGTTTQHTGMHQPRRLSANVPNSTISITQEATISQEESSELTPQCFSAWNQTGASEPLDLEPVPLSEATCLALSQGRTRRRAQNTDNHGKIPFDWNQNFGDP